MAEVMLTYNGCTYAKLVCLIRQIRQFQGEIEAGKAYDRYFQRLVAGLDEQASVALYRLLAVTGLIDGDNCLDLGKLSQSRQALLEAAADSDFRQTQVMESHPMPNVSIHP